MGNQESAPSSSSQKQVLREHNKQPKKKVPMAYHNTDYSQQHQRYLKTYVRVLYLSYPRVSLA
jgi:hypothetical protein